MSAPSRREDEVEFDPRWADLIVADAGPPRPFGWIHDGEFHGLTAGEIAVLVALRSFGGEVGPSLGTIADRAGMPVSGVRRTLESLGAKGRIIRSREDDE